MLRFHTFERRDRPRSIIGQLLVLLCCLTATAYFVYHARHGRHGLDVRAQLVERMALLDFEIKGLDRVRSKLRRDVALLSPEIPNADLVEEIARDVLGYVRPSETILTLH